MAGVTGPCPGCSADITAPNTSEETAGISEAAPDAKPIAPKPTPRQKPPYKQQPVPQQQAPSQQSQQEGQQEGQQDDTSQASEFKPLSELKAGHEIIAEQGSSHSSREVFQSEDAQTERSDFGKFKAAETSAYGAAQNTGQRPRWARWMSVIFPLTFLAAACIVILAILHLTGLFNVAAYQRVWVSPAAGEQPAKQAKSPQPDTQTPAKAPSDQAPSDTDSDSDSNSDSDPASTATDSSDIAAAKTEQAEAQDSKPGELASQATLKPAQEEKSPSLAQPASTHDTSDPETVEAEPKATELAPSSPLKAGALANQNLEKFLRAKTLNERLPLMSKSKLSTEQQEASCLAGELKPYKSIRLIETIPRGQDIIQYVYSVSFEDPEEDLQRLRIIMQLTQRPGVHPPLVHADAFLEHYNKELAQYATLPKQKDKVTFHCIAEARTSALSKDLPEELKKTMVRLLIKSHPYNETTFNAYVNKKSPLMARIGSGKDFPYTRPRFCVLSFAWNTADPTHSYIELKDIVTMTWEK